MMPCPKCNGDAKVTDSRWIGARSYIKRFRRCDGCGLRFRTFESNTPFPTKLDLPRSRVAVDDLGRLSSELGRVLDRLKQAICRSEMG